MKGRPARATAGLCLLVALHVAGCSGDGSLARLINPHTPKPTPGFSPDSPANVLRLLEWSYNHRSLPHLRELFSDDFRFFCSPVDSAGVPWRSQPFRREDELISATHLFAGGGGEPPATIIQLSFDRSFLVQPDPYYVTFPPPNETVLRDPSGRWHKSIRTTVTLQIATDDGNSLEISGHATFYFVRGDSALIPQELIDRGFRPDSTRWWIRRWDDETAEEGAGSARARPFARPGPAGRPPVLGAQPLQSTTWCALKTLYR
ncbi:MAG: hypothetical protein ACRENJ_10080 [Candidatus Eiseniibacteriota bacterium]